MSFVSGFYSFHVDLNHPASGVYQTFRQKIARHPEESPEYMVARVLCYLHAYEPGLELSGGLFESKLPAIARANLDGMLQTQIWLGSPPTELIQRAIRQKNNPSVLVYFLSELDLESFCWGMRGAKENWVSKVKFFLWPQTLLGEIAQTLGSRNTWGVSFIDDLAMITIGETCYQGPILRPDMWGKFQEVLTQRA